MSASPRPGWLLLAIGWALALTGTALMLLYAVPDLQLISRYTVMATAFIPFGLLAWLAATIIFLAAGRRWFRLIALVTGACLVVQVTWTEPYWPRPPAGAGTLTVMTLNMRCAAVELPDLVAEVNRMHPSVVVLGDVPQREQEALQGADWPLSNSFYLPMHGLPQSLGPTTCGTMIFADGPVSQVATTEPDGRSPTIRADLPSGPLMVIPVNTANPSEGLGDWAADLAAVHTAASAQLQQPLIVIGDFNATLEHLPMRRLQQLGLSDAAEQAGAGWLPTFPASGLPPLFAIDHVLVSRSLRGHSVETFTVGGADHRGLVVRLGR